MEVLIFGNQIVPDISFEVSPARGLRIQCKNNFVLDNEGLGRKVSWKDLVEKTEPSIFGYDFEVISPFPLQHWPDRWPKLKAALMAISQNAGERAFLEGYFRASEQSLVSLNTRSVEESSSWPALIPQAWLNWIHYDTKDRERAYRVREEPFRVDFLSVRIVIESPEHGY